MRCKASHQKADNIMLLQIRSQNGSLTYGLLKFRLVKIISVRRHRRALTIGRNLSQVSSLSRSGYLLFPNPPITHWPEADLAIAPSLVAQSANKRKVLVQALNGVWSIGRLIPSCARSRFTSRFGARSYSSPSAQNNEA